MQMDNRIILAGEPVNALGSFMGGQQAAQQTRQFQQQNALADLYKTQGAGIMAGDANALNALAQYDPQAAVGIKTQQQGLAVDQERLGLARAQAAREATAWAQSQDAATVAAEREKLATGLKGAAYFHAQGDQAGYTAFLQQNGLDPQQYPFEQFPAYAAAAEGVLEAWQAFTPKPADPVAGAPTGYQWADPKDKSKGVVPMAGYEAKPDLTAGQKDYKFYADQETASGRKPLSFNEWELQGKKAGATQVSVGGGDNKQVFDAVAESATAAKAAVSGLTSIAEAKKAVDSGIISGAYADQRLGLQKIGSLIGIGDVSAIQNTETFRSAIAPQVAAMMKATVGSTQISNADREFAEKAAGGSITLDEASIKRLLDIMDKAGRVIVKNHIDVLDKVYPEGKGFDRERALFGINLPSSPALEDPEIIDLMRRYPGAP